MADYAATGEKKQKKKYPDKQERLSMFDWQLIFLL